MPVPFWVGQYIDIPFQEHGRTREGVDCWGLVRMIAEEQFGILLPCYATEYETTEDPNQTAPVVAHEKKFWTEIAPGEEQLGDVVVMRMLGQPIHVGMVVGDGRMIHALKGRGITLAAYGSLEWKHRITGFYRYASTADANS